MALLGLVDSVTGAGVDATPAALGAAPATHEHPVSIPAVTASAAAVDGVITLGAGAEITLDRNVALAIPAAGVGAVTRHVAYLVQDAVGSRTVTVPSGWYWSPASLARLSLAPGAVTRLDILSSALRTDVSAEALSGVPQSPQVTYAGAWGMRRIVPSYTGPLVRLRRTVDGFQFDVGATTFGGLDTAYVDAYLQGGAATCVTLYGQNGEGNFTQATVAAQPAYYAAGLLGRPVLDFDGTDDTLILTSGSALTALRNVSYAWISTLAAPKALPTGTTLAYQALISRGDLATSYRCALGWYGTPAASVLLGSRRLDSDIGGSAITTGVAYPGLWQSAVGYRNHATNRGSIWVDGTVQVDNVAWPQGTTGQTSDTLDFGHFCSWAPAPHMTPRRCRNVC